MSSLATFGPVQMLVLEFDRTRFDGEVDLPWICDIIRLSENVTFVTGEV